MPINEDGNFTDSNINGDLTVSDAENLFFRTLVKETEDAPEPSKSQNKTPKEDTAPEDAEDVEPNEESDPQEDDDTSEDPDNEEPSESETSNEPEKPKSITDDDIVEVTVDGEVRRASVRELKRLFGQEAALTRKSQEIAEVRKATEEARNKHAAALDSFVKQARENADAYARIDFLVAQQRMDPESFAQLREDARKAFDHLKFVEGELDTFIKEQEANTLRDLQERAKEAIKVLSNPDTGIPGWNTRLYDEIRQYSITQGLAPETVNNIVDPNAIKLLYKAMRYDSVQKAAKEKVHRKVNAPTKVISPPARGTAEDNAAQARKKSLERLRKNGGDLDSAADAFMATFSGGD